MRGILTVALSVALAVAGVSRAEAQFPTKAIQLQVTFPAGGPTDTEVRIMAKHAEKVLGQRFIIQNVAGAGGAAGWNNVPKAPKDGYWLTAYNLPHIFAQPLVLKEARFTRADFVPLIHWTNDPTVFAVRADSPYKTIDELIADAKAKPETVTLGMAGRFLGHHLAVLQLELAAGIRLKPIPFQGSAPSIAAMLGGQTKGVADNLSDMVRQGNKVRMLAIAWPKRHPLAPDVPTFAEKGWPSVVMSSDRGIAAPAGTPANITTLLADAFWKAAQTKEFQDDMRTAGIDLTLIAAAGIPAYWSQRDAQIQELLSKLKLTAR